MARPKLGKGETQRLQLKISDEELEAIDDWRFANRIGSRSEAVRRLVQIGLAASKGFVETATLLHQVNMQVGSTMVEAHEVIKEAGDDLQSIDTRRLAVAYMKHFEEIARINRLMAALHYDLLGEIQPLSSANDLEPALTAARNYRSEADDRWKNWRETDLKRLTENMEAELETRRARKAAIKDSDK